MLQSLLTNLFLKHDAQCSSLVSILEKHPLGHKTRINHTQDLGSGLDVRNSEDVESTLDWMRLLQAGHSEFDVGDAALHYCLTKPKARAFLFFDLTDQIVSKIIGFCSQQERLEVIYAKSFTLSVTGAENIISLCYNRKEWYTDKIGRRMARERFSLNPKAILMVFESDLVTVELKKQLRELLPNQIFSRRIHGTDTHDETLLLVEAVANPNSLQLINRVQVSDRAPLFRRIPEQVRNNASICVDGSAVLELYGIRPARDIDLLALHSTSIPLDIHNINVNSPNPIDQDLIIRNPRFHHIIYGVKFSTLACRFMSLALEMTPDAQPRNPGKVRRDFEMTALYYGGRQRSLLKIRVLNGTIRTRIRQKYEFFVTRIVPSLPFGLDKQLPALRRKIMGS